MVVLVLAAILMWPYMLSTYVAVRVFGADNPGTVRSIVGWVFEVPWMLFLGLVVVATIFPDVVKGRTTEDRAAIASAREKKRASRRAQRADA
ncbi:hypothetical protein A5N72_17140 [Prescottella equi]|nr:hypothetical protein A5N72_17140 [Prescottella equi]